MTAAHASASAMRKRLAMVTLREERTRLAAERGSTFTCEHGRLRLSGSCGTGRVFVRGGGRAAAWASLGWCAQQAEAGAGRGRAAGRGGYRCVVSGNAGPLVTNRIAEFLIMRAPTDFPIGVSQSSTLIVLEEHFH